MWVPRFACPECGTPLERGAPVSCACGAAWGWHDGIHGFLSEPRRLASAAFSRQYARVREHDGHRAAVDRWWHELPVVPSTHPAALEWRIRRESFDHLLADVLDGSGRRRVLDLGAGCGWLAARLAARGHDAVALDRLDDEADGKGLRRQDMAGFVAVQGDFDAPPFEPGQFDIAVFNASLHYAREPERTLECASHLLAPGGALVVMDSPTFVRARDGESMVAAQLAGFDTGTSPIRPGVGYLTFDGLERVAATLGRRPRFIRSSGPLSWRVRRAIAGRLGMHDPAVFGVWVAQ